MGLGFGDVGGVGLRFSNFAFLPAGDFEGVGVAAGEDADVAEADGMGSTLRGLNFLACDLNSPRLGGICDPLAVGADGAGISVGSSIAVGRSAGVGVGLATALGPGVAVPAGSKRRPRRCDAVGEADEIGDGDVSPRQKNEVRTTTAEIEKNLFMATAKFLSDLIVQGVGVGDSFGFGVCAIPGVNTTVSNAERRNF